MVNDYITLLLAFINTVMWYYLGKSNARRQIQKNNHKSILDEIDLSIRLTKELCELAIQNAELSERLEKYEKLDDATET